MRLKQYTVKKNLTLGTPYLSEVSDVKLPAVRRCMYTCEDVESLLREYYDICELAEEECFLICVDSALKALGVCMVSHGSVNVTLLPVREIYQRALLLGATGIFVVHNHPSGKVYPSEEDKRVTERLYIAGELMGIQLLDHIIVGESYFSFQREGLLKQICKKYEESV